jgi:RHS repeat-associated protein
LSIGDGVDGAEVVVVEVAGFVRDCFTGHEHIDEMGLIHMNGRVYDPQIGRFLSADPYIQSPYNTQSYNRYSYVMNNQPHLINVLMTCKASIGQDGNDRQ